MLINELRALAGRESKIGMGNLCYEEETWQR
jgi:hypothetical protein